MRLLLAAAARSTNTVSFVDAFIKRGHDVHIATLHAGAVPGATVHTLGSSEFGISRVAFVRAIPAIRALHRALRPDVTLGYYASSYGMLATFVPRPRVVVTAGSDVLFSPDESALRSMFVPAFARFALRRADLVLCWAAHLAEAVAAAGVPDSRILTLPRGIDVVRFRPSESAREGTPLILSTRAVSSFYRPELLLDAFLALRERGVAARLEIAGDGPLLATIADRARASRFSADIACPGRVEGDALADRLRAADVYASFPPSDGVSASLLEAMASGLVPVVSDLRTNRDWVDDGVNGLLVPEPVQVGAASAALERALGDRALRERARAVNPARVRERGDRDRNVLRFEEAFAALAHGARARS